MRRLVTLLPILAQVACSTMTGPDASATDYPIWARTAHPVPFPSANFMPGETATVPLAGCVARQIRGAKVREVRGDRRIHAALDGTRAVVLTADEGTRGSCVILLDVECAGSGVETVGFTASVHARDKHTFRYAASRGESAPSSVAVAGSFNGWSRATNPLSDPDADGIWEAAVGLPPGKSSYKFVVNGTEWLLDTDNPKSEDDGGGHVNSIVEMAGDDAPREPLRLLAVPAGAPGGGRCGGIAAELRDGASLDAASVHVFVDNRVLGPDFYSVDATAGTIALYPADGEFAAEQYVTIAASDDSGREGTATFPFDFARSPRSPKDDVIYFAMTDRFADGDPANNNPVDDPAVHPLSNYMGGDLAGLTTAIDAGYLDRLGATALWISPLNVQAGGGWPDSVDPARHATGYHGYWPQMELAVPDPHWGDNAAVKRLVSTAHNHGIACLLDFVANHAHEDSDLFRQHQDYFSEVELPDGRKNLRMFDEFPLTTWFETYLPDIDYEHSAAARSMMATMAFDWLRMSGADGFRHDAVKHVPVSFWHDLTAMIRARGEELGGRRVYQVGETISDRRTINEYVGPDLLDGQFDFPLLWEIRPALAMETKGLAQLEAALAASISEYPAGAVMSPLIGNHDVPRFMAVAEGDVPDDMFESKKFAYSNPPQVDDAASYRKLRLAFAFLLSIPGAPLIYYGDEIGMTGAGDPDNRRMMLPESTWNADQRSTFDSVAAWTTARKASVALRRGAYVKLFASAERLVFARVAPEEVVIVSIARKPDTALVAFSLPAAWGEPKSVEPLISQGAELDARGRAMTITGGEYSAGAWKLTW